MQDVVYPLRGLIYGKFKNEAQCAEALSWPRQKLNKITTGAKNPDIEELNELSKCLGVPLQQMANIFLLKKSTNE